MKWFFFFLSSILIFVSCIDEEFSIGDNLITVNGRSILYEDCTVELETHLGDPSVTTGLSKIFEGKHTSSDFGIITAHSYLDFNPPSYDKSIFSADAAVEVRFDSITLVLRYDDYSYGDTTQMQTINIYKLRQTIELDDKSQLYTTSTVPVESEPWITHHFHRPEEQWENDSILELRLPDEFGLELIGLMNVQSDLLETYNNFRDYFKGIKLTPGNSDNAAVNSFRLDNEYPIIRIYYTTIGSVTTEENKIDMIANTTYAFSQIEADRSNTLLQSLSYNSPLFSIESENKIFLQGLTGLYAKVSFPDLNEILKLGKLVIISSAILYVIPVLGSYNGFAPLPSNLALNYLGEDGKALDIYVDPSTVTVQSGTLVEDKIFNLNTYYAFDVTSYLQYELGLLGMYKSSLQLSLDETDNSNSLKSLVFGDSYYSNIDYRVRLIIYIIVYDND